LQSVRKLLRRPILLILILAALLLSACGGQVANSNWPGLSTDGQNVYLANGPAVSAYDVATQALNWTFPAEPQANLQFFAAPSAQGDRVIFGDYGAAGGFFSPTVTVSVYAVENGSGSTTPAQLWTNSDAAQDKVVAPLLQVEDTVYVGTADRFMHALNALDGTERWAFETEHSIWGLPAYQDGKLFFASMDRTLYALNASTGEELWRTTFSGAMPSGPVLNTGLVYVSGFDSQVHALDIDSGEERWAFQADNWVWGGPAYDSAAVYFADIAGNVHAVDAQNGAPIWQAKTPGAVQTSPVVQDDKVFVASEGESSDIPAGAITAFSASDGSQVWQKLTPAPLFTTPVIVDGAVIVALQSESASLMAFDVNTGEQLWSIAPPEA
jgi:outer membrane protein assembly factor BamB